MKVIHLLDVEEPAVLHRLERLDRKSLAHRHEIDRWETAGDALRIGSRSARIDELARELTAARADLLHIYGSRLPPASALRRLALPWIAPTAPEPGWLSVRKPPRPSRLLAASPDGSDVEAVPEAAPAPYFDVERVEAGPVVAGLLDSEQARGCFDAVRTRVHRLREDVKWEILDRPPEPRDLARAKVWVDFGGGGQFVPEALVAGTVVVAPRTKANRIRLAEGAEGFLVPPDDANEMAHVVLGSLFKPEIAQPRLEAARAARDRYHPSRRAAFVETVYAALV